MSASTVSITAATADPAAAATPRRRSLVAEKRLNVEAAVVDPNANGINLMEDKTAVGAAAATAGLSRDLNHHSGRAEPSKDSMQVRKVAVGQNSNGLQRRSRKGAVNKTENPRWLTAVSIFGKNLALLLVLVGLAQIFRRLALKSEDVSGVGAEMGLTTFEGRVAEVESFLKTTANMIQVQVDVVDKKIENEIGGLRRELNERIEGQTASLEKSLKKLEEKSEELGKSLSELKSADLLTKEEFEKMYEQMLKEKGENGESENPVSLSDLGAYAREIVKNEIEKHASDGLGRFDYALSSGGGKVVRHSEPFLGGKGINWFLKSSQNGVHRDADKILKPSFGEPGQCFPLKGSSGFVQIKLRTAIIPEAVTLEHVAKSVAYDRSSAPKDCRVSGWLQGSDPGSAVDSNKMFLLAEFTYDLEKSNALTFDVSDTAGNGIVDTVRLDFSSNHGSASHTCIYRLRVHGHDPDSVSMVKTES
ncbi:protein ETHYLENE INSENSITIVE 3-like isoform 1 [Hibiscus syriacus]|uniref:Protein ETHYLENE INSENSITIVE 3-like isoform 1 n=1 Tax=Hibiscus syriacus TaxID=106335 RepID=A0A6A2WHY8_HIBSY|nr:SUN domain-containing protein 1-like [Hibiscus syriacus]KAE8655555.1 protein ETHYLENE INSENSITIVE 3-like isoform 1 [Hibiscus syriacus]